MNQHAPETGLTANDVLPHWPLYRLTVRIETLTDPPLLTIQARTRIPTTNTPDDDQIVTHTQHLALTGHRPHDAHAARQTQSQVITKLANKLATTPMGPTHQTPTPNPR